MDNKVADALRCGVAIPAHPLALTAERQLDETRQRALTRYYMDAGAGGVAVGVHTTQFAIHDPAVGLYEPVLALAADELDRSLRRLVGVAGVLGPTERAVREAELAAGLGYDLALVSPFGWGDVDEDEILAGVAAVGEVLPVFGFYLQPAVGGRVFDYRFWRRLLEIPAVRAVKIAPFDRYRTLDVVRARADVGRADDVLLYTGNDDNIVNDLITPFLVGERGLSARIVGGLLGQFAVWTAAAVELLNQIRNVAESGSAIPSALLAVGAQLTDANAAVFDAANGFRGCIPGINEVLVREGVLGGHWCLDPDETLSEGQIQEIDRVWHSYPHLRDPEALRRYVGGGSA
jgi:dihydrodipicolinate synthase/N-acetylneuraminate lyase